MSEYVRVYAVERLGITEDGNLGVTIAEMTFDLTEAFRMAEERKDAEKLAYSVSRMIVQAENAPPEAERIVCQCQTGGDCEIHG